MYNINVVIFVLSSRYRNSFLQETIEGIREIIPHIQNTTVTYCIIPVNIIHKILEFVIINTVDVVSGVGPKQTWIVKVQTFIN